MNSTLNQPPSTTTHVIITPPTYPARPVNGGPFPNALPKTGDWLYEPKYNGWRAFLHVPTGQMFNRQNQRLSIEREFEAAIAEAQGIARDVWPIQWLDVEALERRHNLGRGRLIVLDLPDVPTWTRLERRSLSLDLFDECELNPRLWAANDARHLWLPPLVYGNLTTWADLRKINQDLGCQRGSPFYEGFVAKRADSLYPLQLRSPDLECPFWMKHRWAY